jgi:hypothetical protein
MSGIGEKIKTAYDKIKNLPNNIKSGISKIESQSTTGDYIKSNTESTDNEEVPTGMMKKTWYYFKKYILRFFEIIMMIALFVAILAYVIIISIYIDKKRQLYTSSIKDFNTVTSLADYDNLDYIYKGYVYNKVAVVNFIILGFICFVLFIKVYYINNDDDDEEVKQYTEYMYYIVLIILAGYLIYFVYTMIASNSLYIIKTNMSELQTKITDNIDIEFLSNVIDVGVTNKYKNGEKFYDTDGKTEISKEEADQKYKEDIKKQFPDKIQYDISSIHKKIDTWLYGPLSKRPKSEQPDSTIEMKQGDLNYRFKVLITSVLLVYYINTKNMDPIIRSVVEKDTSYQKSFFLYTDKDANSILPPLSILKTTALYKTVIAPLGETCTTSTFANKTLLDTKYNDFKSDVDKLFRAIKNTDDPFGHKISIIINFLLLLLLLAFFAQFINWKYYKRTILKEWNTFLLHYGRFIVLAIMVLFVI